MCVAEAQLAAQRGERLVLGLRAEGARWASERNAWSQRERGAHTTAATDARIPRV